MFATFLHLTALQLLGATASGRSPPEPQTVCRPEPPLIGGPTPRGEEPPPWWRLIGRNITTPERGVFTGRLRDDLTTANQTPAVQRPLADRVKYLGMAVLTSDPSLSGPRTEVK